MKKIIHISLRLVFGICLFISQVFSNRTTFFSENYYLIISGIIIILVGIVLIILASIHLHKATDTGQIAISGPYKYIRHPIYTSMYILILGLGLVFFSWLWYIVMIVFMPFWYIECREEEKEMLKIYGQEYSDYQNRTKIFVPFII